jgi:hypothetical protein
LPKPVHYLAWDYSGSPDEEAGRACASAEAAGDCEAALAAIRADAITNVDAPTHRNYYYVYTRYDEVGLAVSDQDVLEFLGPIDTVNEAVVVLWAKPAARQDCGTVTAVDGGYLSGTIGCRSLWPATPARCEALECFAIHVSYDGTTSERASGSKTGACVGRRPAGFLALAGAEPRLVVGSHFARVAELEVAAVAAFAELERALVSHGAPTELLERCRTARRDEVRHAALMTELACRYGRAPDPVRFVPRAKHTLLELALENAREGTSRELFGAAVAAWQAGAAGSADARARFTEIAHDEAEHAQFSLDLAAWLSERLSRTERALVEHGRARSFQELERELEAPVAAQIVKVAGVPTASDARRLLRAVRAELA